MATFGLSCLAPVAAAASSHAGDRSAFAAIPKAAWVWGFDYRQARELHDFARAQNISSLFVSLPPSALVRLAEGDADLLGGLRTLGRDGVQLWALAGDPAWARRPEEIAAPLHQIFRIQDRFGLFRGLHLDVEPHVLAEWRSDPEAKVRLAANLAALFARIASQRRDLPLEAALHPSLAELKLKDGEIALRRVCRHLGGASVMAYRDRAIAASTWAAPSIDTLQAAEIPWRIGVLVHGSDEPRISYRDAPPESFLTEMLELDKRLRTRNGGRLYQGLAFEDLRGLKEIFSLQLTGGL